MLKHFWENGNSNRSVPLTVRMSGQFMMKTHKNIYESICLMKNLRKAYRKAQKGKAGKWYVREFDSDLEKNLLRLQKELLSMAYEPKTLKQFVIRDPKTRVIQAPDFRDRVIHHAICNVIEPIFEKTYIFDSYASRKEKGVHLALQRFDKFKRKVSCSRLSPYATNDSMICGFCLKADIRHYFPSIDHEILIKLLRRKIGDEKVISLLEKIIHAYSTGNKGMPLGALTSQIFANVYLNPLDHFIKENLHAKYYLRYLDDFVILHGSQKQLEEWRDQIKKFLSDELKLELHPEKTSIFPLHQGVPLLGFRCFYYYRLLKKSNLRHFTRKVEMMDCCREKSLEGWFAHARWGNTYKLRRKLIEKYNKN